jgi:hypothetical protein
MKRHTALRTIAAASILSTLWVLPGSAKGPDLTDGGAIPKEATHFWVLGASGARGWTYTEKLSTTLARQIGVTDVAKGSPADGVLRKGDVILGVFGEQFSHDARVEFGKALTVAEGADGALSVIRSREGAVEHVTIHLPVLGTYSATAPYECPKSEKILAQTAEALARRMNEPGYEKQNAISRSLNALGLLATGDPKYQPLLKREAEWASNFSEQGLAVWWYGYVTTFLAEYVIATGDESVLPGLRRIAMEASRGQSKVGSWGHRFAGPDGRLFGYGMMNSPGEVMTIGLVLAREAGVDDPEVATAIERSVKLLRFYIGKGSIPYGDHAPYMVGHEDNGKCGMAVVLFDQLGDEEGARFFSKMSIAAHGNERDQGHTGNFFNMTWAMPGVSRGGPEATGAWMHEFGAWYYDLARTWDWEFPFPGQPKEKIIAHNGWDMTGAVLIAYAMPRKAILLTGKKPSCIPALDAPTARQLIHDGRGYDSAIPFDAYDDLAPEQLLGQLASWSPIVRDRTAVVIAKKKNLPVEQIMALLDAPTVEARLGACQALTKLGSRAAPAVPKLIEALDADDLWLRVQAAEALSAIGREAMPAVPHLLTMVAKGATKDDPRAMEQRFLSQILFNGRNGMLKNSLEGVDRAMLLEAVRAGLANQDGRTRGAFASVYTNLSLEELRPILPEIHRAILEKSPSGIMFDGQIQNAGLDLYSRHHIREGIVMIADYTRLQKPHGSDSNLPKLLKMLNRYGVHAKQAIPSLEKTILFLEDPERKDFPHKLGLQMADVVRKEIRDIEQLKDTPELIELNLGQPAP